MKQVKLISARLIAVFVLITGYAVANNADYYGTFLYPVEGSKKADIVVINGNSQSLQLTITNPDGVEFYSENIAAGQEVYKKRFNFLQMYAANYQVVVKNLESGKILTNKHLTVNGTSIEVKEKLQAEQYEKHPSYIDYANGKLQVSYINTSKEDVTMEIRDANGNLVFTHPLGDDIAISKLFNVSGLWPGEYDVALYSESQKITSTVKR